MKKVTLAITMIILCGVVIAQEEEPQWGIKFKGFVNVDYFWDTRQTVAPRDGHFILWPAAENLDPNNEDINARASFNMLAIRTRLRGLISGPDVLGAKTSAIIEGSFFGHSNSDLNGFRLREAYAKLNWENTELILGQTWHPMFIPACFPDVMNFNTGTPFQPFARNPQVRVTHDLGLINVSATAMAHVDFYTAAGTAGLRNSGLPELHFQAWYEQSASENNTGILLGGGAGYKRIIPEIQTIFGYKTSEGVGSFAAELYSKLTFSKFTVKAEAVYGQNNYDVIGLSSYARTSFDPITGISKWTSTSTYQAWAEIYSNNDTWKPGFFAGYSKNLGAGTDIIPGDIAGTRGNIDYLLRLSPRMYYISGKMKFGLELEYSVAAFGTPNAQAKVENAKSVGNLRTMLGAFYYF